MFYYYLFLKKYFILQYEKLFLQDIDPALTFVIVWPNYMISEYHTQLILKKITDITYATCVENQ